MNNNLKFNTSVTGIKGYELHLENIKFIKNIDVNYFLKNYKISNIWRGKWFIKKLIHRIFKRRIHQEMQWEESLWDRIEVNLIEATVQKNKYPDNWKEISSNIRMEAKYICSNCGDDLSDNQNLLHVHHIDGHKWNSKPTNLQVLCFECHTKEPGHEKLNYLR